MLFDAWYKREVHQCINYHYNVQAVVGSASHTPGQARGGLEPTHVVPRLPLPNPYPCPRSIYGRRRSVYGRGLAHNFWVHWEWLRVFPSIFQLNDWLFDWLTDWLTDWLADWLLPDWLTDWLADWLTDWLADWQTDWLIDWLTDWLTDWLNDLMTNWLNDWLNDWLID